MAGTNEILEALNYALEAGNSARFARIYSNSYEVYWERNDRGQNSVTDKIQFNIIDVDETTKKIVVQTGEPVNGIADVYLDYEVKKNQRRSSLLVFKKLFK